MSKVLENQVGSIVLKERSELKPSEITLGYLVEELNVVTPLDEFDYDINIKMLDLRSLEFLEEKRGLKQLFCDEEVLTIERLYRLKLLDLSYAGIGLVPEGLGDSDEESSRYKYLSSLIQCANNAIKLDKEKEVEYSNLWRNNYEYNLNEFELAQCKNRVGISLLYKLRSKIRRYLKKIEKAIKDEESYKILDLINDCDYFVKNHLFITTTSNNSSNKPEFIFKKLGFKQKKDNSLSSLIETLDFYRYILNSYNFFLSSDLKLFKSKKVKKATNCFLVDSFEMKKTALDSISDINYIELNKNNLSVFYNFYRESLAIHINKIISDDIKKRKFIDGIFQYSPVVLGVVLVCVAFILSFDYNFTLLKEMQERHNLMIIYGIISVFALITLINLYRNAKQFKRPKRKKFSKCSLTVYLLFTILFSCLNLYYIHRFDGYDNTFYYVFDDENIKIDGLRNKKNIIYEVPQHIDGYQISSISNKIFKKNPYIEKVDLSNTSIDNLGVDFFRDCSNLKKVYLPNTINIISKNAFKNCSNLYTLKMSDSVQRIDESAFEGCSKLGSVDLSNVIQIGKKAFYNCESLGKVLFNDELEVIPKSAFNNCASLSFNSLPKNLIKIEKEAFKGCESICELNLGSSIETIGQGAFYKCNNIDHMTIENFAAIKDGKLDYVFSKLDSLKTLVLINGTRLSTNCLSICPNIERFTFNTAVATIGKEAFMNCTKLQKCNIIGTITSIGERAFKNCYSLSDLNFNDLEISKIEEETFYNCSLLNEFSVPNTVTEIKDRAFYGCEKISSFNIPSCVSKIGDNILAECKNLKSLTLPLSSNEDNLSLICDEEVVKQLTDVRLNNAAHIPSEYFKNCFLLSSLTLDTAVQSIGDYAFKNCHKLIDFDFVKNAKKIGIGSFYGCSTLSDIELNNEITKIPNYLFYGCSLLRQFDLSNHIEDIGDYAFAKCNSLSNINIESNINSIGEGAFEDCSKLKSISIPLLKRPLKEIFGESLTKNISTLTINSGNLTNISDYFFADCSNLNEIIFNVNVTAIGKYAFSNCFSLNSCEIPNSVTSIGDYAFNNCIKIISANVPTSVKQVGKLIFNGCYSLKTLNVPVANTKSIGSYINNSNYFNLNSITLIDTKIIPDNYFMGFTCLKDFDFTNYQKIGKNAFSNTGLEEVSISSNIDEIGEGAFSNCNNLRNATINANISKVPSYIFSDCAYLLTAKFSMNVVEVGEGAFLNCKRLNTFKNWEYIIKINYNAFSNCEMLTGISLDNVTIISSNAFSGCKLPETITLSMNSNYKSNAFNNTRGVKNVIVSGVLDINSNSLNYYFGNSTNNIENVEILNANGLKAGYFSNCTNLKSIKITGTLTRIVDKAFSGLTNLTTITLPDSVEIIGSYAFEDCNNLKKIVLPKNLKIIEERAFYDCKNIEYIELNNNMEYIGNEAFNNEILITNKSIDTQENLFKWHENWMSQLSQFYLAINISVIFSIVVIVITLIIIVFVVRARRRKLKKYELKS